MTEPVVCTLQDGIDWIVIHNLLQGYFEHGGGI